MLLEVLALMAAEKPNLPPPALANEYHHNYPNTLPHLKLPVVPYLEGS